MSVNACYVIVNDVHWRASSVLNAIDICFKSYFTLHAEYPPEARHLWMLVQQHLYGITLAGDSEYACVTDFKSKLDFVSAQEQ